MHSCNDQQGNENVCFPLLCDSNKEKLFFSFYFFNVFEGKIILPVMILCMQDFEEYPEHRTNFFLLLQAVNSHCFQGKTFSVRQNIVTVHVPCLYFDRDNVQNGWYLKAVQSLVTF